MVTWRHVSTGQRAPLSLGNLCVPDQCSGHRNQRHVGMLQELASCLRAQACVYTHHQVRGTADPCHKYPKGRPHKIIDVPVTRVKW